jgi:hypothetical protein
MEGHLRRSKYVGFLVIALGIILIVGAAVLPVSAAPERLGPFRVDLRGENCGPAGYVVTQDNANEVCKSAAHRRLLSTTGVGLLIVALGMALFAGPEQRRGSMIEVPTRRVSRRPALRSPGSRRYKPG